MKNFRGYVSSLILSYDGGNEFTNGVAVAAGGDQGCENEIKVRKLCLITSKEKSTMINQKFCCLNSSNKAFFNPEDKRFYDAMYTERYMDYRGMDGLMKKK